VTSGCIERGSGFAGLVDREKVIRRGIAQRVKEAIAASGMAPALGVYALSIHAHVQKGCPFVIVKISRLQRPSDVRLAAIGEL